MKFCHLFLASAYAFTLSSCYLETTDPKERQQNSTNDNNNLQLLNDCKKNFQTKVGCVEISLPSSPEINVESKTYRDAATFANNLKSVFVINNPNDKDDPKTPEIEKYSYSVNAIDAVTNANWAKDFKIYVKGPKAISGASNFNQGFFITDLPEGTGYQARIEKELQLEVITTISFTKPDGGKSDKAPVTKRDIRCAMVFKEFAFDVTAGAKTELQYDSFDLTKPDVTCASSVNGEPVIDL